MSRRAAVVVVVVGLFVLVGCGGESEPSEPQAARDTSVHAAQQQPAGAAPSPDHADRHAAAERARSRGGGVLRGTFARLNGKRENLARYRGDVVLVVNTATQCGYTPQFEGLEALYKARKADGLIVLGFPANDFGGQEPRSNDEIAEFCKDNYGVSFPMFVKSKVTGEGANALFRRLSSAAGEPEWNFNKYLIDRRGKVVARFGAGTEPDAAALTRRLDQLL